MLDKKKIGYDQKDQDKVGKKYKEGLWVASFYFMRMALVISLGSFCEIHWAVYILSSHTPLEVYYI